MIGKNLTSKSKLWVLIIACKCNLRFSMYMLGTACYQQIQIHQKPNIKKFDVGYFLRYVSMTYCFRVGRVEKNVGIRSRLVLLVGSASEGGYSLWLPQRSQIRLIHRHRAFRQKENFFGKAQKIDAVKPKPEVGLWNILGQIFHLRLTRHDRPKNDPESEIGS